MGSVISQLINFKIITYDIFEENERNETEMISLFDSQKSSKDAIKFHKCLKTYQQSLIHYM
jgi:hypothetical protein